MRGMDFPGADLIADRFAASNPLSQIDEKSDIPPQAQMMIKGLQAQLQKAGQQIQALEIDKKYRLSSEQMKQAGATQRTHMQETVKAHDVETMAAAKLHETQTWAAQDSKESEEDNRTRILIEEMKAQTALLLKRIDERMDEKQAERKENEPRAPLQ